MSDAQVAAVDHEATLLDWRAQGLDRVDPVRFAFIDGLVRRAARQGDGVRQQLDERIGALLASYGEAAAHASLVESTPPARAIGPLGALAALIDERAPSRAEIPGASAPTSAAAALDEVRETWARLEAEKRLKHAVAQAPGNAGPLNSYQLVLRALLLMREVSPEYLQRFIAHVDTLMWLERTAG